MPGVLKSLEPSNRISECSSAFTDFESSSMAYEGSKNLSKDDYENGTKLVNGGQDIDNNYINGFKASIPDSPPNNATGELGDQSLPEIEHITFGFLSLSTLITRLVQETFNGLTDVINELSDLQVSQSSMNLPYNQAYSQTNGNLPLNNSHVNVQKKLRILNFAQDYRAQFIKILVLSNWSRQAKEISKVIDLKIWLDGQKRLFEDATWWMGELKRTLGPRKMPNPDIKTALEALSLGKATWLPDLNYIPPAPLLPYQTLKALRNINTLLSIRLNLYENVPHSMREFSISSGRATFLVHEEFEVELSLADEDPSSQLYFIDFRFKFSPAPNDIPGGALRREIEDRVNEALKRGGLDECFRFLHDLVLTYKISILRNQAFEMARGLWLEHLKVELLHRSLVVQYWPNKPGGKNWIEIGIKRRKDRKSSQHSSKEDISHIAFRWFRGGKDVSGTHVNLNLHDLSLQGILKQIITIHTNHVFEEIIIKIKEARLYSERLLKLKHNKSVTEPLDASLIIQLTPSRAVKITQEPVTGKFALQPTSQLFSRLERDLNTLANPATEAPARIALLRCIATQEELETCARVVGWEEVKSLAPGSETKRRLFPLETLGIGLFRRKSWSPSWIIAFTTSMVGDSWWVVKLSEMRAGLETEASRGSSSSTGTSLFKAAYRVPMIGFKSLIMEMSYSTLTYIEKVAVGMISDYVNTVQLKINKIDHKFGLPSVNSQVVQPVNLYIRSAHKHITTSLQKRSNTVPWVNDIICLTFKGVDSVTNSAIHIASARLKKPIKNRKGLISSIDDTIALHPSSGDFAFRLLTSVGESSISLLLHQLSSIERLTYFLSAIRNSKLSCESVSLSHIEFIYAPLPLLSKATIRFPPNAPMSICLDKGNPHLRIQDHLNSLLRFTGGLEAVVRLLSVTLPLLETLSTIETLNPGDRIRILPRSAEWYHVRYESPRVTFDIRLRQRRGEMMWFLKGLEVRHGQQGNEQVAEALKTLSRERGAGWRGMTGGIIASPSGVADLIQKIDEVYRSTIKEKEDVGLMLSSGKKRKAEDEIVVLD